MGSDIHSVRCNCYIWVFNSRSLRGERLHGDNLPFNFFQFSLPTWRATKQTRNIDYSDIFSIHAPRMESDRGANRRCICIHLFNSRSPYGERPAYSSLFCTDLNFQFTLPAWRATVVGFSYDFILLLLFISAN